MNCKSCSKEIPADSRFCPYCGTDQAATEAASRASGASAFGPRLARQRPLTTNVRAMRLVMGAEAIVIIILVAVLATNLGKAASSTPPANPVATPSAESASPYAPPVAIKEVVAQQHDPDDFVLYLELADKNGQITRASGSAAVQIIGPDGKPAFTLTRNVKVEHFVDILIGSGSSAHYETIYSFGLVKYEDLGSNPSGKTYTLHATFDVTGGSTLSQDTTITLQ